MINVNTYDYSKYYTFVSNLPQLQIHLMNGDIENISLEALMLNISIEGNYIDRYSSHVV